MTFRKIIIIRESCIKASNMVLDRFRLREKIFLTIVNKIKKVVEFHLSEEDLHGTHSNMSIILTQIRIRKIMTTKLT